MQLLTPRLVIRDFREGDLEAIWEIEADPEIHRFERQPPSYEDVRERVKHAVATSSTNPRTEYRLVATLMDSDLPIGRLRLQVNQGMIREWELGWTIHHAHWGNGYATEAAFAVMRFAFKELNAHRLIAFCHADNIASARVMEKLGMRREARMLETRWLNDAWHDELLYAILEREFFKQTE